jgi:hypothetical protein
VWSRGVLGRQTSACPAYLHAVDNGVSDAAAEELVAETVAYSACASSGIAPGEFSIGYLAGWSERT